MSFGLNITQRLNTWKNVQTYRRMHTHYRECTDTLCCSCWQVKTNNNKFRSCTRANPNISFSYFMIDLSLCLDLAWCLRCAFSVVSFAHPPSRIFFHQFLSESSKRCSFIAIKFPFRFGHGVWFAHVLFHYFCSVLSRCVALFFSRWTTQTIYYRFYWNEPHSNDIYYGLLYDFFCFFYSPLKSAKGKNYIKYTYYTYIYESK